MSRAPVYGTCLGRDYGRGNTKISETLVDRPFDVGVWCLMLGLKHINLARRAPPSVGGGLKTPRGGTAAHPPFGKSWLKFDVGVR